MEAQRIIVPKRRFFAGKRALLLAGVLLCVAIGAAIQMRMTWSRERLRGVTSDAADVIDAAKTQAQTIPGFFSSPQAQ